MGYPDSGLVYMLILDFKRCSQLNLTRQTQKGGNEKSYHTCKGNVPGGSLRQARATNPAIESLHKRLLGQAWLEVAASRVRAGEPEEAVLNDYGYVRATNVELPRLKPCPQK